MSENDEVSERRRRAPNGLGTAGKALWASILDVGYELRPDEFAVLTSACRTADLAARLEAALADQPLVTRGSMGQDVVNPLATELRLQRMAQANLLKQLALPDIDDEEQPKSLRHQNAANARWRRREAGF